MLAISEWFVIKIISHIDDKEGVLVGELSNTMTDNEIHHLALCRAKNFKTSETELLEVLQWVDEKRIWEKLGHTSLCQYALLELKLSEDQASNFSRVARKSKELPELKEAIWEGRLNISQARRIVTIINPENQKLWIEKASTLKQRELDREIACVNPKAAVSDRIKPVSHDWNEIRGGISQEAEEILRRVQDLESQRTKSSCHFNDAIIAMGRAYLNQCDPITKAERNIIKASKSPSVLRRKLPSHIKHQVMLRDQGQCRFVGKFGRCASRRWLDVHHQQAYSEGGDHALGNLITLCKYHHKYSHERVACHESFPGMSASTAMI